MRNIKFNNMKNVLLATSALWIMNLQNIAQEPIATDPPSSISDTPTITPHSPVVDFSPSPSSLSSTDEFIAYTFAHQLLSFTPRYKSSKENPMGAWIRWLNSYGHTTMEQKLTFVKGEIARMGGLIDKFIAGKPNMIPAAIKAFKGMSLVNILGQERQLRDGKLFQDIDLTVALDCLYKAYVNNYKIVSTDTAHLGEFGISQLPEQFDYSKIDIAQLDQSRTHSSLELATSASKQFKTFLSQSEMPPVERYQKVSEVTQRLLKDVNGIHGEESFLLTADGAQIDTKSRTNRIKIIHKFDKKISFTDVDLDSYVQNFALEHEISPQDISDKILISSAMVCQYDDIYPEIHYLIALRDTLDKRAGEFVELQVSAQGPQLPAGKHTTKYIMDARKIRFQLYKYHTDVMRDLTLTLNTVQADKSISSVEIPYAVDQWQETDTDHFLDFVIHIMNGIRSHEPQSLSSKPLHRESLQQLVYELQLYNHSNNGYVTKGSISSQQRVFVGSRKFNVSDIFLTSGSAILQRKQELAAPKEDSEETEKDPAIKLLTQIVDAKKRRVDGTNTIKHDYVIRRKYTLPFAFGDGNVYKIPSRKKKYLDGWKTRLTKVKNQAVRTMVEKALNAIEQTTPYQQCYSHIVAQHNLGAFQFRDDSRIGNPLYNPNGQKYRLKSHFGDLPRSFTVSASAQFKASAMRKLAVRGFYDTMYDVHGNTSDPTWLRSKFITPSFCDKNPCDGRLDTNYHTFVLGTGASQQITPMTVYYTYQHTAEFLRTYNPIPAIDLTETDTQSSQSPHFNTKLLPHASKKRMIIKSSALEDDDQVPVAGLFLTTYGATTDDEVALWFLPKDASDFLLKGGDIEVSKVASTSYVPHVGVDGDMTTLPLSQLLTQYFAHIIDTADIVITPADVYSAYDKHPNNPQQLMLELFVIAAEKAKPVAKPS